MTWSKIQDTDLAKDAIGNIAYNTERLGLTYHNLDHVASMYNYLEETNEPYDEALDWAVLFHDIVYDSEPNKEIRSAEMLVFNGRIPKYHIDEHILRSAKDMILGTIDHEVISLNLSAIIRADLHGLTDVQTVVRNFSKIMDESCNLYSIDAKTFAAHSNEFMLKLKSRVCKNIVLDPQQVDFYNRVIDGIMLTNSLAVVVKSF